eukprot:2167550-Prymnesium_polylepis.1
MFADRGRRAAARRHQSGRKAGGAGGFPHLLPCVGRLLWGIWYAFDGFAGPLRVRRRVAYRANRTHTECARNACAAHCAAVATSHRATHATKHCPTPQGGVGQMWRTVQAAAATVWSSLLCDHSRIVKRDDGGREVRLRHADRGCATDPCCGDEHDAAGCGRRGAGMGAGMGTVWDGGARVGREHGVLRGSSALPTHPRPMN